jgi:hypothetical protein
MDPDPAFPVKNPDLGGGFMIKNLTNTEEKFSYFDQKLQFTYT